MDDTKMIQEAVNWVCKYGGTVHLLPGRYEVGKPIRFYRPWWMRLWCWFWH